MFKPMSLRAWCSLGQTIMTTELDRLLWSQQRQLVDFGLPDWREMTLSQPSLAQLGKVLDPKLFREIVTCTNLASPTQDPCQQSACPRCMSVERTHCIVNGNRFQVEEGLQAYLVTYVPAQLEVGLGQLHAISPSDMVEEFRHALIHAASFCSGPVFVVGGIDVAQNDIPSKKVRKLKLKKRKLMRVWAPHIHAVAICRDPEAFIARLRENLFQANTPQKGEFHAEVSVCTGRHIAYATKSKPVRRSVTTDSKGNVHRKSKDLAMGPMREAVGWLSQTNFEDRIFKFYQHEKHN